MACPPDCIDESSDPRRFREAVISLLNCLLDANQEGVRYDWEFLCDPDDGSTIVVRYSYEEDGTLISVDAFLPDGSPYAGAINDLVPCLDEGLVNTVLLCDLDEYGDVISAFLAHVKITTGAPASITFTEVDSVTPYVITGDAGACSTGSGGGGGVGSTTLLLCDVVGGSPTQFLRRIDVDSAAAVTITDTTLDGSTPYVTSGTVGRCEDPDPLHIFLLCDVSGGVPTQFLRRIEVDESGTVTVTDTTLDGSTPYVTAGTVGRCEDPDPFHMFLLCDIIGGSPTQFLRRIEVDESGTVTITDTTLDGSTPYVTSGTVSRCDDSTLNTAALCDSDDGTVFLRHYIFIENAFDSFFDTDLDGVSYTLVGTAVACEETDDEILLLCDSNDGTRFLRKISTDSSGDITVTDYELDGTTLYTVVGTAEQCCCSARDDEYIILCDDNDDTRFLRQYSTDEDGTLVVTDTLLDGTTSYTVIGNAVDCSGDQGVSAQTLCDVDQYGDQISQFTRVWNSDGTFSDFEMDGTTPYTPTGTIEDCCCEAQTQNVSPTSSSSSTTGSTTAGVWSVSITNIGGAAGTVNGVSLPADMTVAYTGYYDEEIRDTKRIASVSFDATGTTFRIDEVP